MTDVTGRPLSGVGVVTTLSADDKLIVNDGGTIRQIAPEHLKTELGAPIGSAGGVLSGNYPNPGFAADMATQDELNTHAALMAAQATVGHTSFEAIQDMLNTFLQAGANITLTYSDAANTLMIAVSGLTSTQISNFSEAVDDRVAALIVAGANITKTYDDTANTLTLAVAGDVLTQAEADALYQRQLGVYNVVDYGATGNGTTSDTAAIQAALTAGAGATVVFPKPAVAYRVTSALSVPSKTTIRIDPGVRLEVPAGATHSVFDIDGKSNVTIRGHGAAIGKASGAATSGTAYGVWVRGNSTDVVIEGLTVESFVRNFNVAGQDGTVAGTCERITFRDCTALSATGSFGFNLDECNVVTLENCYGRNNWLDGIKVRRDTRNVTIRGGAYTGNGVDPANAGDGIDAFAGGDTLLIEGGVWDNNDGNGITIKSDILNRDDPATWGYVRNCQVIGARCRNNNGYGWTFYTWPTGDTTVPHAAHAQFVGCHAEGNGLSGAFIDARNVSVYGGTYLKNGHHGIQVELYALWVNLTDVNSIANSQATTNTYHGIYVAGQHVRINGGTVLGVESDTIYTQGDYLALTPSHNRNIWVSSFADDVIIRDVMEDYNATASQGIRAGGATTLTTVTSTVAAGATTWTVADNATMLTGRAIELTLDNGVVHRTFLTSVSGTTITVSTGPATQASSGNLVTSRRSIIIHHKGTGAAPSVGPYGTIGSTWTQEDAIGGAVLWIKTSGDSNVPTTGWSKQLGDEYNVLHFGAKGDGIADDTAAIQAAIDAPGRTIFFPKGDYVISSQIGSGRTATSLLVTGSNIRLIGEPGARLIMKSSAFARPFLIRNASNVVVEGLAFIYDGGVAAQNGLVIENSSNVIVRTCTVDGFPVLGISVNEDTSAASVSGTTFSFSGNRISDSANGFASGYTIGDTITVSSSDFSLNEGIRTVTAVGPGGAYLDVSGSAFTTESAGTLYTVAVLVATACDNIRIEHNTITNCEQAGIITFPKTRSRNLWVTDNKVHACGLTANGGIKAGQGHLNAIIARNEVSHCEHGIIAANWETCEIVDNQIDNCYDSGITLTHSFHPKYIANFDHLIIARNQIAWTKDYVSGLAFNPAIANTVKPSLGIIGSGAAPGITINGLQHDAGPISIDDNDIVGCGNSFRFNVSLTSLKQVTITRNRIVDSGSFLVDPLAGTGDTTSASTTITNVSSTSGWYVGSTVQGSGIPTGTTVTAISGTTFTISAPATTTAVGVAITSGYPDALTVTDNHFRDTRGASANGLIKFYSPGGLFERNIIDGYIAYALQLKGDKQLIARNTFKKINQLGTASRSPILVNDTGTYRIVDNLLDNSEAGTNDYLVRASGGGTSATVIVGGNRMTTAVGLATGAGTLVLLDPHVNVTHHGAKCDGITDNAAAIQAAINSLPTAGGTLFFPPGICNTSLSLVVSAKTNVVFAGVGSRYNVNYAESASVLRYTGTGSGDFITVDTNNARNFGIRDLAITYSSSGFTGNLLRLGTTVMAGCLFENVYFGGPGLTAGTALYTANACVRADTVEFLTFRHCYFTEADFGYLGGAGGTQQSGITFDDCVFGDLEIAQIRSTVVQGLAWNIDNCKFDPIRIQPQYGVDLACNGFRLSGCIAAGTSAAMAPSIDFYRLTGRGKVDGGYMTTNYTGIRFLAGGVYELSGGARILAAAPVIVEGGVFVEHDIDYVVQNGGTVAVDIVPGALSATTLDCGPSRFAQSAATAYSYRSTQNSAFVVGYIRYSAQQDATTNKLSIASGSAHRVKPIFMDAAPPTFSVEAFGATGDGTTDDTAAIQAALTAALAARITTLPSGGTTFGVEPEVFFPKGRYLISNALTCPAYVKIISDGAIIQQADTTKDILVWTDGYMAEVRGLSLIGGRHQMSFGNANTDSATLLVDRCHFQLNNGFVVNTTLQGGVTNLSSKITLRNCRMRNIYQAAYVQPGAFMTLMSTWLHATSTTIKPASALIENHGDLLRLIDVDAVPPSTYVADSRWIDNYSQVILRESRFGGEGGGMSPVWNYAGPQQVSPFNNGGVVIIDSCELACGPAAGGDDAVAVRLVDDVPQKLQITNNWGLTRAARPLVSVDAGLNLATYIAALNANVRVYVDVSGNVLDIEATDTTTDILPAAFYDFPTTIRIRQDKRLTGSATWDPVNLPTANSTSTTVTVTGARLGDLARASFSQNLQQLELRAEVSANNTVTVVLRNDTGVTVDLASGTLRVLCERIS